MIAGDVLDGEQTALLDVDEAVELLPEPRDRRAVARAQLGQIVHEGGVRGRFTHEVGQRLRHVEPAGRLPVVEADAGVEHELEVVALQEGREDALPAGERPVPDLTAGQDAVLVGLDAAAGEAVVDVLRHPAEVLADLGVVRVGVGEPVVLVRGEREFVARGAPEDEPGEVHRRRAVAFKGELEQACGHGVVEHREHAADQRRVEARVDEVDEQRRHVSRGRRELVLIARALECVAQGEGTPRIEAHQVAGRDDADHAPVLVQHGQMADAVRQHGDAGLRGEGAGADGVHRRRHDGAHRRVAGDAADDDPLAQVDVGDDAEPVPRAHDHGRVALGAHQLGGRADGRLRVAQGRCSPHHGGHRQRLHLGQGTQGTRRVEQRVPLRGRQPADAVLTAEQLHAEVRGDAVERAVGARAHRERRRRAGEQAGVAEELAAVITVTRDSLRSRSSVPSRRT